MTTKTTDSIARLLPTDRHTLKFTQPPMRWDEGLPLGNGSLGAVIWGNGDLLKISLDRTDLWDLTKIPEWDRPECNIHTVREWHEAGKHKELVDLLEGPYNRAAPTKIPAGRIELALTNAGAFKQSTLNVRDAIVKVDLIHANMQSFVHATQPVGVAVFRPNADSNAQWCPMLKAPAFAGPLSTTPAAPSTVGELALLKYSAPTEASGDDWQAFTQFGAEGFSFAVYLAWRKTSSGPLLIWSVASSFEGPDVLAIAKKRVEIAFDEGFDALFATHQKWWTQYWSNSGLRVANPGLEKQWHLEQYKFGSACRRGAPAVALQGPWTADNGGLPPWKGDYHHDLNTQLSYWPCYSGNHLEEGLGFLEWLWNTRDHCREYTRQFFQSPGLNVPMTADLLNRQMGGWRQYCFSSTTGAWISHHFYLRFSRDEAFLRERAYPYLRECSEFLEAITAERDENGLRRLPLSASPEIHNATPQAWFQKLTNYDLALIRWLFGATAELANLVGESSDAAHWRGLLAEFPSFALAADGTLLIGPDQPLDRSHRHHSNLLAIHPLGMIDVDQGAESKRIVESSLRHLDRLGAGAWAGYSFCWHACLLARAYDGEAAQRALDTFALAFTSRNSFHLNGDQSRLGYCDYAYPAFTLEGNFAMAAALQEMLLQSHRGRIEVFPAVPKRWLNASFTTLRADGAFLVSAERREGKTTRVEILAEKDGTCRLQSPAGSDVLKIDLRAGERAVWNVDRPAAVESIDI